LFAIVSPMPKQTTTAELGGEHNGYGQNVGSFRETERDAVSAAGELFEVIDGLQPWTPLDAYLRESTPRRDSGTKRLEAVQPRRASTSAGSRSTRGWA
jgi:hypothetical protein